MDYSQVSLTRRKFLYTLLSVSGLHFLPKSSYGACRATCEPHCNKIPNPIALIVSLTGWGAGIGSQHASGAKLAIEQINAAGGKTRLQIFDAESSPVQAFQAGNNAAADEYKVVVGVLGAQFTRNLAERYPTVVFFDIAAGGSTAGPRLRNSFQMQRITSTDTQGSTCPSSEFEWQTYLVFQLLSSAVRRAQSDDVNTIISRLNDQSLPTAVGTMRLSSSGVFNLQ